MLREALGDDRGRQWVGGGIDGLLEAMENVCDAWNVVVLMAWGDLIAWKYDPVILWRRLWRRDCPDSRYSLETHVLYMHSSSIRSSPWEVRMCCLSLLRQACERRITHSRGYLDRLLSKD